MKKALIVIIILLIFATIYIQYQEGKIVFNKQFCGLILLKGRYRSWLMHYSYGQTWDINNKEINLWKWPNFSHFDIKIKEK